MQISNLLLPPLLCLSLFVNTAMAEGLAVPDKEHRRGMSYEEYTKYRENMRSQMNRAKPEARREQPDTADGASTDAENSQRRSAYGQGYHSRPPSQERPDRAADNRPERPRAERFNRDGMGRR